MGDDKPRVSRLGRAGRMTVTRKREGVIRLLRGDDLELVGRELGVTAATLSNWRDALLQTAYGPNLERLRVIKAK